MRTVEAYYDGRAFVPVTPVTLRMNEKVIITIFENSSAVIKEQTNDKAHLRYAGALSNENYDEIVAILKDTEQIDTNTW